MTRNEIATKAGLDGETIRYYESIGIISEPQRKANGYRNYSQKNLEEIKFVQHCRSLGLSLAEIKKLQDLTIRPQDCHEADLIIQKNLELIEAKMKELKNLRTKLKTLANSCSKPGISSDCKIVQILIEASQGEDCLCHHTK